MVPNTTYPSLGKVKFDECGTLVVPSGPTLALFAFTAGKDPTVVCLGEAVAKRAVMIVKQDTERWFAGWFCLCD